MPHKKIVVKPLSKLSMQRHEHRSEFWVIMQGVGILTHEEVSMTFPGDSHYIPAGDIHRIENPSNWMDLIFFEVQTGDILDENDIIRISDEYGRS